MWWWGARFDCVTPRGLIAGFEVTQSGAFYTGEPCLEASSLFCQCNAALLPSRRDRLLPSWSFNRQCPIGTRTACRSHREVQYIPLLLRRTSLAVQLICLISLRPPRPPGPRVPLSRPRSPRLPLLRLPLPVHGGHRITRGRGYQGLPGAIPRTGCCARPSDIDRALASRTDHFVLHLRVRAS